MKMTQKDSEKFMWDHHQMRSQSGGVGSAQSKGSRRQLMVWLTFFVTATYVIYTLKLLTYSRTCDDGVFTHHHNKLAILLRPKNQTGELDRSDDATYSNDISYSRSHNDNTGTSVVDVKSEKLYPHARTETRTNLEHIVFGIASSAQLWNMRKSYIKLWWKPERKMRGVVWLDSPVKTYKNETNMLPELKISQNTSEFLNKKLKGHPSAIRISRIVSETLRLGMENVRWFVMGDDDTVFFTENLVRVLNNYDHNQFYYIGSSSESHLQNIFFSYSMAYGGGGFAISYPLAKALGKMQDRCIKRYPTLFASDDRMQACMAELGVPLTKHLGFHQFDVHGNVFGLLAAHPVTPLVSLHHLDVVEPIFPNVTRVEALQRLTIPMKLDSAGLMQQSVCYVKAKKWTVSVSWGFAVQIYRGVLSPREIEMPSRTFLNWYKRADYTAYAFNTRPVMRNPCQKPYVFYMSGARMDNSKNQTVSQYTHHRVPQPECRWKIKGPDEVDMIEVYKKPDPHLWDRSPRRNCCRILNSNGKRMVVDVGICREDEVSEM